MNNDKKLCLVCSSGGHFFELYSLDAFWKHRKHFWVTFPGTDTRSLLQDDVKYWGHHPTNRNMINFIRNFFLALKILRKERPDLVVSTGAGVGVPFIYAAKLMRIRTIYIETIAFSEHLSLSGKLVYFVVDHLLVQWPELARKLKKAEYRGTVL